MVHSNTFLHPKTPYSFSFVLNTLFYIIFEELGAQANISYLIVKISVFGRILSKISLKHDYTRSMK